MTSGALSSCTWSGGTSRYFHSASQGPLLGGPAALFSVPSALAMSQHQDSLHGSRVFVHDSG